MNLVPFWFGTMSAKSSHRISGKRHAGARSATDYKARVLRCSYELIWNKNVFHSINHSPIDTIFVRSFAYLEKYAIATFNRWLCFFYTRNWETLPWSSVCMHVVCLYSVRNDEWFHVCMTCFLYSLACWFVLFYPDPQTNFNSSLFFFFSQCRIRIH